MYAHTTFYKKIVSFISRVMYAAAVGIKNHLTFKKLSPTFFQYIEIHLMTLSMKIANHWSSYIFYRANNKPSPRQIQPIHFRCLLEKLVSINILFMHIPRVLYNFI